MDIKNNYNVNDCIIISKYIKFINVSPGDFQAIFQLWSKICFYSLFFVIVYVDEKFS
jgi:hypothetical protein